MPAPPNKPNEPIQHVIVLMMENRSFDQMLGGLSGVIDGLDGPPKAGEPARTNKVNGKTYKQTPARTALSITTPSTSSSTPCTNSITTMAAWSPTSPRPIRFRHGRIAKRS